MDTLQATTPDMILQLRQLSRGFLELGTCRRVRGIEPRVSLLENLKRCIQAFLPILKMGEGLGNWSSLHPGSLTKGTST
jgi:hypothetical protein